MREIRLRRRLEQRMLDLNTARELFAAYLAKNATSKGALDAALAHVVTWVYGKAYREGYTDGATGIARPDDLAFLLAEGTQAFDGENRVADKGLVSAIVPAVSMEPSAAAQRSAPQTAPPGCFSCSAAGVGP